MVFIVDGNGGRDRIIIPRDEHGTPYPMNCLVYGSVGSGKCVDKNSLITMADGTTKPIHLVEVGDKVISYDEDGCSHTTRVLRVFCVGQKRGFRLKLVGGLNITASADHKFLKATDIARYGEDENNPDKPPHEYFVNVWDWHRLGDLKRMDLVAIPKEYWRRPRDIYDPNLYELFGYLLGDGGLRYDVSITIQHAETAAHVSSLLPSQMMLSRRPSNKYAYGIICRKRISRGGGASQPISFNPIKDILSDLGLIGHLSIDKFIPPELLCAGESNLFRLLSGLITTDGWIDAKGVGYCTSSDRLKEDFCTLLKNLGLTFAVSRKYVKYKGTLRPSWQFGINRYDDLIRLSRNCNLLHKGEKLRALLETRSPYYSHKGINKKFYVNQMEFCRVSSIEELSDVEMWDLEIDDADHNYIANNIIVHNSLIAEQLVNFYHRHGYTIISLSDVKDTIEFGFSMFPPRSHYHIRNLNKFNCPAYKMPVKLYHPYSPELKRNAHYPADMTFYTINIKDLTRVDLNYLAETPENKRSIQILLEEIRKLGKDEGIWHLIFRADERTESIANLTKSTVKYRSDDPNTFFTRSKLGTEKTSSEMNAYFQPFISNHSITPASFPANLDIRAVMNDQEHYHIFTTKWVRDARLKRFYILHLLQHIIENAEHAKHPILIHLEEIRYLSPAKDEGANRFLAEEIKNEMTRFRNMGRGFGIIGTTQAYWDVNNEVISSFNELVIGRLTDPREKEKLGKALRFTQQDSKLLDSLDIGDFIIRAKDEFSEEPSWQSIVGFAPPHAHAEGGQKFLETYHRYHPDRLQPINDFLDSIEATKERLITEVSALKDRENVTKRDAVKQDRDSKLDKEKERVKLQLLKTRQGTERKEVIDDKLRELIYNEWTNATGKAKSLRAIATKFDLRYKTTGEPNAMAVKRAIEQVQRKRQNETGEANPLPTGDPTSDAEMGEDEIPSAEELYDETEHSMSD